MKNLIAAGLMLVGFGAQAFGATLHVDEFVNDQQSWTGGSGDGTTVTHGQFGGVSDGFLQVESNESNLATYSIRSDWTGNLAALGSPSQLQVQVALKSPSASEPLAIRFVLFGPGDTDNRWTSTAAQIVPADNTWRNYTFSLAEAALTRVDGTGTYAGLMAGTLRVMFRHDPGAPSDEGTEVTGILGIDNAELASESSPSLPGDFDDNGAVNATDLNHPTLGWKARFGSDLNGGDFLTWQRNVGSAGAAAVPEPAALAIAAVGLATTFVCGVLRRRVR